MISKLPSTKSIQAFLISAEHLNFTHAANAMNMTQGALSRQIKSLEELAGGSLFFRQARGLALTSRGELLRPRLEKVLEELESALVTASDSPTKVKLNAPSCITSWLLPRLMDFQQAYPSIDIELTSTIKHSLEPSFDTYDAVILFGKKPTQSSIFSHELFEEKLAPMCSPQILVNYSLFELENDPVKLTQYPWLHANKEKTDWTLWLQHINKPKLTNPANQQFATLDQAMNAAIQGFGIAIGDVTLAANELEASRLIQLSSNHVKSGSGYYLTLSRHRQTEPLSMLCDWLTATPSSPDNL